MSAFDLQNAIGDTLLQVVLQQKAQAKKQREQLAEQAMLSQQVTGLSSKVYAKAA
jgi:hypothetical protein